MGLPFAQDSASRTMTDPLSVTSSPVLERTPACISLAVPVAFLRIGQIFTIPSRLPEKHDSPSGLKPTRSTG